MSKELPNQAAQAWLNSSSTIHRDLPEDFRKALMEFARVQDKRADYYDRSTMFLFRSVMFLCFMISVLGFLIAWMSHRIGELQ